MDLFDALTLIGGLCLFLFGMNLMGVYLEKSAGSGLKRLLGRLTSGKAAGFLTGAGVTAVVQSSSATTVMVVGFVNSGLMTLRQAINVILGANVGTTATAWLLSLTGIESDNVFVRLLKPSAFTPVLALIGIVLYLFFKNTKRRDVGVILLGFATLMFGMETMSGAVSGLRSDPAFAGLLTMFRNPIMGVLAGALLTAVIQSSSASVGILQALSSTGQITVGMSIPIIMGQNIGTCVTALLSSVGTNRNARRASVVHLAFNTLGTVLCLSAFWLLCTLTNIAFLNTAANEVSIAAAHSVFNLLCTAVMLPAAGLLERLALRLIPEPRTATSDDTSELDERLMATPAIALERCRMLTADMANGAMTALHLSLQTLSAYREDTAEEIRRFERQADHYEDILGSYLVKLNARPLSDRDSRESAKLLHMIGDLERISDHAVNVLESAEEIRQKGVAFGGAAGRELGVLIAAVNAIVNKTKEAFDSDDLAAAAHVEPLEQVIDSLKAQLRTNHIRRVQKSEYSIEAGFVWSDLLNDLERIADHCSNIAGCLLEMAHDSMDVHEYLRRVRAGSDEFADLYEHYAKTYTLTAE